MFPRRLSVICGILLLAACSKEPPKLITDDAPFDVPEDAPFWPRFHGPRADNISADTGLMRSWPESGPPAAWTANGIGEGYAGVTTADGLIYTAGNLGDYTVVTALYLDGRIRWQKENGPAWSHSHEGTRGTPTIDGDRLYHESPLGQVACFEARSGEMLWSRNILDEFGGENLQWALAESVLIDGDHVICCPGGDGASMVALDKQTGETVWKAEGIGQPAGYASPTMVEHQGLRMILTMTAKALIGVNADTGELLFRHPHTTEYDVNVLMPIFHDGHVLISSGYGSGSQMLKIDVAGRQATVTGVWQSGELDNQHGGVVLVDGYLYGAAHNRHGGGWICLDFFSGQMQYAEQGVGKGSLTYAEGMLYVLSEKGTAGLVEATPDGHQVISQFKIPTAGDGPSWAHPVVCGGRLYIRHGDVLYAYDVMTHPTTPTARRDSP